MATKKHHYLPASHLSRFASGGVVHVYDKLRRDFRSHAPSEIGHRRYFYLTEEEAQGANKEQQVVESFLAAIEDHAAPAVGRVHARCALERLDKSHLSWFVASLVFRTPMALDKSEEVASMFLTQALEHRAAASDETSSGAFSAEVASNALRLFADGSLKWSIPRNFLLDRMIKAIERASRILFNSRWEVLHAPPGKSFVTGDGAHILDGPVLPPLNAETYRIFVPLTDGCCLHTIGEGHGVQHKDASLRVVRELNLGITYASREIVVGRTVRLVRSLARHLDANPKPEHLTKLDYQPRFRFDAHHRFDETAPSDASRPS